MIGWWDLTNDGIPAQGGSLGAERTSEAFPCLVIALNIGDLTFDPTSTVIVFLRSSSLLIKIAESSKRADDLPITMTLSTIQ